MLQQDSSLTSILGDFSIPRMLEGENKQKPHNAQVISYCPDLGTEQLSPWEGLFQVPSTPLVNHSLFYIPLVSFVTWDFALSLLLAKQATRYHPVFLVAPETIFPAENRQFLLLWVIPWCKFSLVASLMSNYEQANVSVFSPLWSYLVFLLSLATPFFENLQECNTLVEGSRVVPYGTGSMLYPSFSSYQSQATPTNTCFPGCKLSDHAPSPERPVPL